MQARNNVKKANHSGAAAQLGSRLDYLVARWLERCAGNAEAAQRLFSVKADRMVVDRTIEAGAAANSQP